MELYSLLCQCCSNFKWEIQAGEIWSEEKEKNLANLSRYINNFKFVMAMLNGFEDQRTLRRLESWLRLKVKAHLLDHLKLK